MKYILSLSFFLSCLAANTQTLMTQTINATGKSSTTGSGITVDWSVGEIAIATLTSSGKILTQGTLQPQASSLVPIQLVNFSGNRQNNHAFLNWIIKGDDAEVLIAVEHSTNGLYFLSKELVRAAINESRNKPFNYIDSNAVWDSHYYRLKIMDGYGNYTYSKTIELKSRENNSVSIFPNPVSDLLQVSLSKPMNAYIEVVSESGKIIMLSSLTSKEQNSRLDFSRLPSGTYFIRVKTGEQTTVKKIVKL